MPPITKPILCYVTDRRSLRGGAESVPALLGQIDRAATRGVDWIQIREKDLTARALAEIVSGAVKTASTRILVNDHFDVALGASAAGVHLGGESLPVAEVVRWKNNLLKDGRVTAGFLVGASCHSMETARAAERDGADYVSFGPVFSTPSKESYGSPQGLDRLGEVCGTLQIPVLAIGGITLENAASCFDAGAAGLAAIRLFQQAADLKSVVARLRGSMRRATL